MYKKIAMSVLLVCLVVPMAIAGYPSDVTILEKKDVALLTDDQLTDAYINTIVEIQANNSFHSTSGFSPKEFKEYKALLKYKLVLLMEIHSRNLEIPQFER